MQARALAVALVPGGVRVGLQRTVYTMRSAMHETLGCNTLQGCSFNTHNTHTYCEVSQDAYVSHHEVSCSHEGSS